jgi:hypothetical protein
MSPPNAGFFTPEIQAWKRFFHNYLRFAIDTNICATLIFTHRSKQSETERPRGDQHGTGQKTEVKALSGEFPRSKNCLREG